jgi:hypothetical protein
MGHALDVYVTDCKGNPLKGAKVRVVIGGFLKGGSLAEFTDDDGHAAFKTAADYEDSRKLVIHVGGESFGPYRISGGAYSVQIG